MPTVAREQIETAIQQYVDPWLGTDLIAAKRVEAIEVEGARATVRIALGYPARGHAEALAARLRERIEALEGVERAEVSVTQQIVAHAVQHGVQPIPNVKNVIAVASGKGGVGKSTTAVNLALALAALGAKVGILDADIHGPSLPRMLGTRGARAETVAEGVLAPVVAHDLQSMSMGYLVDEETPMVWRGPMVAQALTQLVRETRWAPIDYLVVDLPPGTGDAQLTLAQKIPVSGALIVTTPQEIALLDARKGLRMFAKVRVATLGIVENMGVHICSQCGHEEHIFSRDGGAALAAREGVDFLGALPLDAQIREDADGGRPTVVADPHGRIAQLYREIAGRVAARLSLRQKSWAGKFPKIVVT